MTCEVHFTVDPSRLSATIDAAATRTSEAGFGAKEPGIVVFYCLALIGVEAVVVNAKGVRTEVRFVVVDIYPSDAAAEDAVAVALTIPPVTLSLIQGSRKVGRIMIVWTTHIIIIGPGRILGGLSGVIQISPIT